ncbi:MAG: sigma-70 family RNA polymerase sigma factor [Planctomycetes bacterium]|nr:sigma-70 family RNA polymerase sigma factor [Planctomycetota bacterium]
MIEIDLQTIRDAQHGDESACRQIIADLHRPILATIFRFLGPRYRGDYEDIAQDVFLKLFRSIERFDPARGVKFTTWAFTFVRNHCFDILKRRRLPTASLTTADDDRPWELQDPSTPGPGASVENTELGSKIGEAIAGLGEDQRLAFILREYEGLEYASIAEVMGVSEGTIKSRIHRAKEALRLRLAPYLRAGA